MPPFVVITKLGIAGGFNLVYQAALDVFPTLFCGTAIGICNFFARVISIFAPIVAEQPAPLPMIILTGMSVIGIFAIRFVTTLKEQRMISK